MITQMALRLVVGLPAGWHRLPAPGDPGADAWCASVAGHAHPDARARHALAAALSRAMHGSSARAARGAARFVSIGAPATTTIMSLAFVEVAPRAAAHRDLEAAEVAAAMIADLGDAGSDARDRDADGLVVLQRSVAPADLVGASTRLSAGATDPAIIVDELFGVPSRDATIVHRRVVVLRVPEAPWVLQVTASTAHLLTIPTLDAVARAIAASTDIEETT